MRASFIPPVSLKWLSVRHFDGRGNHMSKYAYRIIIALLFLLLTKD